MSVPIWKLFHDIGPDIVNTHRPISECIPILHFQISCQQDTIFFPISDPILVISVPISDNIGTCPFLAKPDITNIGPDIGFFPDIGPDIRSISGHTRSLPNQISGFSPISSPIWSQYSKKYRDIRISEPKNHYVIPDGYAITQYTNIVYIRYRGDFFDIGDDISPAAPPSPARNIGHGPGAPMGPASWSSACLDSLYTTETLLTPFPAALHTLLREMCSSTARRVEKKVVAMLAGSVSWQLQQIN
jgi:hypothetical protein